MTDCPYCAKAYGHRPTCPNYEGEPEGFQDPESGPVDVNLIVEEGKRHGE